MKWSWRIARVFGIDIHVHATFFILLAWIALRAYLQAGSAPAALRGVALTLAVFGTVVLHELGHALTARRFGVRTRDITLLPIGGVARLERMPDKPWQELLVALAGPLVNLVIAALLLGWLAITGGQVIPGDVDIATRSPFVVSLLWINVTLAFFNMLPAFPMDGGRAVRALLAMQMDYVTATRSAALLGQGMALLLGLAGLFFNPMLVLAALFVWMGAAAELGSVQTKAALEGVPVRAAMITDFRTLSPDDTLAAAAQLLLHSSQIDFPVIDASGNLVGVLEHARLLQGLAERGNESLVFESMERKCEVADPRDMLSRALERLEASKGRLLCVAQEGELVGIMTLEHIGELLLVRDAARLSRHAPARGWA